MHNSLKALISKQYDITIIDAKAAPRQFVAETWALQTSHAEKLFVKVIDKPLFIPEITGSLPVLREMKNAGIDRISYPIPTLKDELFIMESGVLIVLFNYIDAPQTYDYSEVALGELLAQIHKVTHNIRVKVPCDNFIYQYKDIFESYLDGIQDGSLVTDSIMEKLNIVIGKYIDRITAQYKQLNTLSQQMGELALPKVITHGDAGGNTLAKSQDDIYLIDWDGILLAPAERDTWVPTHDFLDGYRRISPEFMPHPTATAFYTLMYYFRSMAQYLAEIISDKPIEHRLKNLHGLEFELLEGWMVPYLKRIHLY